MTENKKKPNIDTDFENTCLSLIMQSQINDAYKLIADHRSKNKRDGSMGIDWAKEKKKGLEPEELEMYLSFFLNSGEPEKLPRAAIIFWDMMGNPYKAKQLLRKLKMNVSGDELDSVFSDLNKYRELRNIAEYKRDDTEKYEIIGCNDDDSCELCKKMNGKVFKVSEAEPGVNLPPFCDHCRCTTAPYVPDL